jgi:elongation factor Ts
MLEVNCETDFVAKSPEFREFAEEVWFSIAAAYVMGLPFNEMTNADALECQRKILLKTKEKCVFNHWWIEEPIDDTCRVFGYVHHPADKLGSMVTLKAPSVEIANSDNFTKIGSELAMQIAAMNPVAVSSDRIPTEILDRQKNIFLTQVKELNKPAAQQAKILEGKLNKWFTESCLLKQESILFPKRNIESLIKNEYATQLGGELTVVNFIRHQVGS